MIARRSVLKGSAAAVVLGPASPVSALEQCPAPGLPPGICSVMLDPARFAAVAAPRRQEQSQWCWAACIEMICRWHGYPLSQRSIVERVFGGIVNMPGDDRVLTSSLNSAWTDDNGRPFRISAEVFSPALGLAQVLNDRVVEDLQNDRPMLNGSRSHATVVARVDYTPAQAGAQPTVHRVHVIDPWPGGAQPPQYARFLDPDEIVSALAGGSLRYLASVRIAAA